MLRTYVLIALGVILAISQSVTQVSACPLDSCPAGYQWTQRLGFNQSSNGCGAYNVNVDAPFMANECCDRHDYCFSNCSNSMDTCNDVFRSCMLSNCETYYGGDGPGLRNETEELACKAQAGLFYFAVEALGCAAYRSAQDRGCECYNGTAWVSPDDDSLNSASSSQIDNRNVLVIMLMTLFTILTTQAVGQMS